MVVMQKIGVGKPVPPPAGQRGTGLLPDAGAAGGSVAAVRRASLPQDIIVNGKFLRAPMTGVHRVAYELCNALADLREAGEPRLDGRQLEVWRTHDGARCESLVRLPVREIGLLEGIAWEQLTLPLRQGAPLLLNLCNIGPVLSANAVTMIHDVQVLLSPESYSRAFRFWYRLLQPILARRNRALLTVSDFSREQIARAGLAPIERIHTVHNGVDHILRHTADPSIRAELGLTDAPYALALATTQAHKNIPLLLKAFSRPEMAGMRLVLFGSADRAAFVAAGHAVPPNVVFAGRVSDGQLRGLIEGACALAFPSETEGFGLPPLEAMTLGTPAVCAPRGALPEVCGDRAIYVDCDDVEGWARALLKLASEPDYRAALGQAAREHAARYTWRNAALRLLDVLELVQSDRIGGTQR